jgi:hypothetical protein
MGGSDRRRWSRFVGAAAVGVLIGGLITPTAAFAAGGDSWTGKGTSGSLWTDVGNWSAGVPQNGDSVTIGPTNVTATPHVTGMPGGLKLKSLTLTNSSLDGGAVTITGAFTWSVAQNDTGSLNAALTVQGPATISGPGQKDTLAPLTFESATEVLGGLVLTEDTGRAFTNTGTFTLKPGAKIEAHACCVSRDQFVNSGTPADDGRRVGDAGRDGPARHRDAFGRQGQHYRGDRRPGRAEQGGSRRRLGHGRLRRGRAGYSR